MPARIQLSRRRGWRKPPGCVVVSRPSKWGNPFVVGRDGDAKECVRRFADEIHHPNSRLGFSPADIEQLRGQDLGCWCTPGADCHADVLLQLANMEPSEAGRLDTDTPRTVPDPARLTPCGQLPEPDPRIPTTNMTAPILCLFTEVRELDSLVEHPRNPNKHPEEQIALLAKILQKGWRNPIVVSNQSGFIIKGHGRLGAARLAGLTSAPVELQDYANNEAEIADLVADNRIAELSEIDPFALSGLLEELRTDPDFDLLLTGFNAEHADELSAEVIAATDVRDGITGSSTSNPPPKLADTNFKFGPLHFEVKRDEYLRWQEAIRQTVGFNKAAIAKEILRRLGIPA